MPRYPISPVAVEGNLAHITLPCGRIALIDADLAPLASGYAWYIPRYAKPWRDHFRASPVAWCAQRGETIRLNRLVMGSPEGVRVFNLRGNYLDCRRQNLFIVDIRKFQEFCRSLLTGDVVYNKQWLFNSKWKG